ncbi:MAG: 16S rRNA (uracil(1498)-N(3))-methyltransferase [Candidatus Andersenbacteria bacterium]|nr:16S rRNA (uracil(1498)-N(3))-methyltransferase [Candidatus Andersenbacteria bacterium]
MKFHRFMLDINLNTPQTLVQDAEILKQWRNVLRFQVGDKVMLCDGEGQEALGVFESLDKTEARLKLERAVQVEREPRREITLYCAILKRENFEWVAQKAVEVGVRRVVPVMTERTIKKDIRVDRLQKIMKEAAEQSGRGVLPILHPSLSFEQALVNSKAYEFSMFFDGSGPKFEPTILQNRESVGIFIGPEGGWSEKELELAEKAGLLIASLGDLTLRAETAAIVATYLVSQ